MEFLINKNIKKGVVHMATYAVGLGSAWLAAKGFTLTPEQQSVLIAALTGVMGSVLTMARNYAKVRWPNYFGWL